MLRHFDTVIFNLVVVSDFEYFLFQGFNEFAVIFVVWVKLKIFSKILFGLGHVLLVEIIVAHVVVHGLGVGCVAVAVWTRLEKVDGFLIVGDSC